jgi:translation initiation factor 3 subunit C
MYIARIKFPFFLLLNLLGFEELMRAYTKALPVIAKEEKGQTPRFYVRCLMEMEDFINDVWEDREGR